MKKTLVSLLLVLAMLMSAFGGAFAEETKVLDMLWFSDGQEGASMQALIDEYESLNPGIEIELVEVPYADLNNTIRNRLNANQQPALARTTTIGEFGPYMVKLDEYLGEDFQDRFVNLTSIIVDDHLVAATMENTAAGVIYNKTAFDKAGVEVPSSIEEAWTWDEFVEALKTVMEKGDVMYGLVVDKTFGRYMNFMYQAGGRCYNDDMTAAAFNSEENRNAIEYFYNLHKDGIVPMGVWLGAENPNTMFRSGQVAAHIGGSWLITSYDKEITDFEWGVTYLPKGELSAVQSACKYLTAFEGSGMEKEAADFIEWFTRPENFNRYLEPNYFITSLVDQGEPSENKYADAFQVFADEIAANESIIVQEQANPIGSTWQSEVVEMISATLADQMSFDEFVQSVDDVINEAIEYAAQ